MAGEISRQRTDFKTRKYTVLYIYISYLSLLVSTVFRIPRIHSCMMGIIVCMDQVHSETVIKTFESGVKQILMNFWTGTQLSDYQQVLRYRIVRKRWFLLQQMKHANKNLNAKRKGGQWLTPKALFRSGDLSHQGASMTLDRSGGKHLTHLAT